MRREGSGLVLVTRVVEEELRGERRAHGQEAARGIVGNVTDDAHRGGFIAGHGSSTWEMYALLRRILRSWRCCPAVATPSPSATGASSPASCTSKHQSMCESDAAQAMREAPHDWGKRRGEESRSTQLWRPHRVQRSDMGHTGHRGRLTAICRGCRLAVFSTVDGGVPPGVAIHGATPNAGMAAFAPISIRRVVPLLDGISPTIPAAPTPRGHTSPHSLQRGLW